MTTIFVTAKVNDDETGELIEKVEFLVIAPQEGYSLFGQFTVYPEHVPVTPPQSLVNLIQFGPCEIPHFVPFRCRFFEAQGDLVDVPFCQPYFAASQNPA